MSGQTFLVEIGTEELPPKALKTLAVALSTAVGEGLTKRELPHGELYWYASPRRLAVVVEGLEQRAADRDIEALGPPLDRARDASGDWTKAASGFARKYGVAADELESVVTDKGARLVYRSIEPGAESVEVIPQIVSDAITQLPIPKRMRWGASRTEFVRPVHWIIMLYGDTVVEGELLGMQAGRTTRGHRFHCNKPLPLDHADHYVETLYNEGRVIADFDRRRDLIAEQVEEQGRLAGGQAVIDPDLLDEVTGLTEWPVALKGGFEERFLKVPAEALVSSMKEHQKYFHVVDEHGALLPAFITVANIESQDPAQVIDGNERVIRPRLSDAAFFYNTDLRTPLAERVEQLRSVVFQQQLGSMHDKAVRLSQLAASLAPTIGADPDLAARAGLLAKADLVSDMVFEFGDMQGIAGYHYARHDNEHTEVAQAMVDQYRPRFAGDQLPLAAVGSALALADRFDTLAGIFGIGQPPTGSKDPFALRRASVGILRIIIESGSELDLRECAKLATEGYTGVELAQSTAEDVVAYILERLRGRYLDQGMPAEVYMSVAARKLSRPLDIEKRVDAVHQFTSMAEAQALASANKRVANILAKEGSDNLPALNADLLVEDAEKALAKDIESMQSTIRPLLASNNYADVLATLAALQIPVDRFFDEVMVMVEDAGLRANRLALLSQLRSLFLEVADISLLVPNK
jgi:glycyl-tRNA synthetase beta chain